MPPDAETTANPTAPRPRSRGLIVRGLVVAANALGDLIVPPLCLVCRVPMAGHDSLCAKCWQRIDFIRRPLCDRLGIPLPYGGTGTIVSAAALASPPDYDRARAVARFDGAMRELIHGLKYSDRHDGRKLYGRWLAETGSDLFAGCHVIVPVPLDRWRLLGRRYNQAAILAAEIAQLTGIPSDPLALVRRRRTTSQVGLSHNQRKLNVSGAFAVAYPDRIAGRNVLLVDDVITTSATLDACARVLRRAGAARIDVLALARVTDQAIVPG